MTAKEALRQQMKTRLREDLRDRETKSAAICAEIARHPAWQRAGRVALFDAMPSEPALAALHRTAGRRFFFPRLHDSRLRLIETIDDSAFGPAVFRGGYREPFEGEETDAVDLILVPGLAFTAPGARLGRGGGHYDRLLERLPAATFCLGVCFALQLMKDLPLEPHDRRMTAVITEAGLAA